MKYLKRKIVTGISVIFIVLIGIFFYADMKSSSVVPVLMYHSITPDIKDTSPCVSPEAFEKQMEFLARRHYNVVGPDTAIAYIKREEKMPPKTVMITADDGFYDFYKYAFPLLKKYNFKAVVFMTTDKIGDEGMLGWKELREMSDSGLVIIGSHTSSHPWLPQISVDEEKLDKELKGSKVILENGLQRPVEYICYPNGGYNDLIKETAKAAGYKGAFTTNPVKKSDISDIYAIRRIKMSSSSTEPLILWGKISRYYAWFKERR